MNLLTWQFRRRSSMYATRIKKTARKHVKGANPSQLSEIRDDLLVQRRVLQDLLTDLNEHAILLRADKDGLLSLAGLAKPTNELGGVVLPHQHADDEQYLRDLVESMIRPDLNLAVPSASQCKLALY